MNFYVQVLFEYLFSILLDVYLLVLEGLPQRRGLAVAHRGDKDTGSRSSGKGASLVAQWLRICLPMQGTRVRALVWEDPTCRGAAGPVSHNY